MLHRHRKFIVKSVDSKEELAKKLTEYTWCGCNGFELGGYLFLNDSTGPDGAQEYGVFRGDKQIESITFGWCSYERALELINEVLAGDFDNEDYGVLPQIVPTEGHRCHLCI